MKILILTMTWIIKNKALTVTFHKMILKTLQRTKRIMLNHLWLNSLHLFHHQSSFQLYKRRFNHHKYFLLMKGMSSVFQMKISQFLVRNRISKRQILLLKILKRKQIKSLKCRKTMLYSSMNNFYSNLAKNFKKSFKRQKKQMNIWLNKNS
jgi:hypothetical protein